MYDHCRTCASQDKAAALGTFQQCSIAVLNAFAVWIDCQCGFVLASDCDLLWCNHEMPHLCVSIARHAWRYSRIGKLKVLAFVLVIPIILIHKCRVSYFVTPDLLAKRDFSEDELVNWLHGGREIALSLHSVVRICVDGQALAGVDGLRR